METNESAQSEVNSEVVTSTAPVSATKSAASIPAAIITGSVIIAVALLVVFGRPATKVVQPQPTNPSETPTQIDASIATIRPNDHVRGNATTAQVVIFEYSDSDCSFCARFHPTLVTLVNESKGNVAWVYRHFPLDIHPNAYTEALALECVADLGGPTAFNTFLDKVMNVTLNPDPKGKASLVTYARDLGIDSALLKTCMESATTAARVDSDIKEAQTIGARGTPFSIMVNTRTGKQAIIPGAYPIENVRAEIENVLK